MNCHSIISLCIYIYKLAQQQTETLPSKQAQAGQAVWETSYSSIKRKKNINALNKSEKNNQLTSDLHLSNAD